eukprot:GHVT01076899.1.p1 GENE.GHVT01076899.1~~GHVT01076899.1.p1  ORF type:complete len:445 (-),score=96.26 GHVT01076899.1:539-1873(-)
MSSISSTSPATSSAFLAATASADSSLGAATASSPPPTPPSSDGTFSYQFAAGDEELEEYFSPCLSELTSTASLRWIFVGGKGGVGKTTASCALALKLAQSRESVLLLSTDPAHNLSDALSQKLTSKPTKVDTVDRLWAMEIDSTYNENFEFRLSKEEGWTKMLPELLQTFPGIDEALSFAELMQSVKSMKFDVIVFDTAPTGHTLRLLSFPDILEKALQAVLAIKEKVQGAIGMISAVSGQQIETDEITQKLNNLKALTTSVRETFQDATRTTFVCVCIPEFLSVYETERLVQELAKQQIDCSNIIVNQVVFPLDSTALVVHEGEKKEEDGEDNPIYQDIADATGLPISTWFPPPPKPEETMESRNQILQNHIELMRKQVLALGRAHLARRKMQSKYLRQIRDLYATDFHVVAMPARAQEVRGVEFLQEFSDRLLMPVPLPLLP